MAPDITDTQLMSLRVQEALKRIAAVQERIDRELAALHRHDEVQATDQQEQREGAATADPDAEAA